jgi:hypothetical protein
MTEPRVASDGHGPACSCCGRGSELPPTPVRDRRTGRAGELLLCEHCLGVPGATWRLRWAPVKAPAPGGER